MTRLMVAMMAWDISHGLWAPGVPPYLLRCDPLSPSQEFFKEEVPFSIPAPRLCSGARFLPVSFAIPKEDVLPCVPEKFMDFAPLVPGLEESYVFPMTSYGEMEYKRMYRESRFGVTKRRAGWETMRIYEILACGSVPYIHAANEIPDAALVYVNKTLLRQAQQLVANAGQPPRDAFSTPTVDSLDLTKYVALAAAWQQETQAAKQLDYRSCRYDSREELQTKQLENNINMPRNVVPRGYHRMTTPRLSSCATRSSTSPQRSSLESRALHCLGP
ncbi:unnamed protein product [Durusdinium trenchii]|uniref:Uncharacterized protein n=1 Tax=Durusdinium trenchii TaxID=1381693 RepID=A0ABP0HBF1_9DINO